VYVAAFYVLIYIYRHLEQQCRLAGQTRTRSVQSSPGLKSLHTLRILPVFPRGNPDATAEARRVSTGEPFDVFRYIARFSISRRDIERASQVTQQRTSEPPFRFSVTSGEPRQVREGDRGGETASGYLSAKD